MKKTPLYDNHVKKSGKIIDFGGWMLPVQYEGIIKEHGAVREAAGLFDVSHMGEVTVKGRGAEAFIQNLITNDISGLNDFQAMYSPMCYPDGGTVDDIIVYKINSEDFLIVVNAANTDKDYEWMLQNKKGDVVLENVSDSWAQLALQGPKAQQILQKLTNFDLSGLKFFRFAANVSVSGVPSIVSRSGYTGEDGFEVYAAAEFAPQLWESMLEAGKDDGLVPAGLGARDTLRFEAALPLYGHELTKDISPLEAGLGRFVKLEKETFIGREALLAQSNSGLKRMLVGFEMTEPGVARNGFEVFSGDTSIGFVTSGSYSPTLEKNLGLALVGSGFAEEGTEIEIAIRNKSAKAKVVKKPFYTKKYKK
jgi:aminomethyltransferase